MPVHRFFRTDGSGHFLTASATERDAIGASRAHSHFRYEGVAFFAAPQEVPGAFSSWRTGTGLVRSVGGTPGADAQPVEPSVEDAYLLLRMQQTHPAGAT